MFLLDLLNRFTAAIEGEDVDGFAALFASDGVYHDAMYGSFQGRGEIARMLREYWLRDGGALRWDMFDPVLQGRIGYANWLFSFTSKLPGREGRAVVEGASRLVLDESGRILSYREWADASGALLEQGMSLESLARFERRHAAKVQERPEAQRHLAD